MTKLIKLRQLAIALFLLLAVSACQTPEDVQSTSQPVTTGDTQSADPSKVEVDRNMTELQGSTTKEGIQINLPEKVLFEYKKYEVRESAEPTLSKINQLLRHYSTAPVLINGHTDNKGSTNYNQKLSEQRSAAVKDYLIDVFKVDPNRLQTQGLGETQPIAANNNPDGSPNTAGREKNRRVEFIIKIPENVASARSPENAYKSAINAGMNASMLTQNAKTQEEWKKVATMWQEAIDMMKAVPESNPNYETAQKKAAEYESNLNYAKKKAEST